MQILQWQRQVLRESAVMHDNTEHSPSRAMCLEPSPAKRAQRTITVGRARHIDLAHHASREPPSPLPRGHTTNLHNFADKFVSWRPAKIVIATQNLHVGIANPCQPYAHQRPSIPQSRHGPLFHYEFVGVDYEGEHLVECGGERFEQHCFLLRKYCAQIKNEAILLHASNHRDSPRSPSQSLL
jgi:hypothetical protein